MFNKNNTKQRFSLRKYTFGAASVLLGTFFAATVGDAEILPNAHVAKAADVTVANSGDFVNEWNKTTDKTINLAATGYTGAVNEAAAAGTTLTNTTVTTVNGNNQELTLRGVGIDNQRDLTIKETTLNVVASTGVANPSISSSEKLTLENVKVNTANAKPDLKVTGGTATVKSAGEGTEFNSVDVKNATLTLEGSKIKTPVVTADATSNVVSSSELVGEYQGGNVTLKNLTTSEVKVKDPKSLVLDGSTITFAAGQTIIADKLEVKAGSTLNIGNAQLTVRELLGTGTITMNPAGKLTVDTLMTAINVKVENPDNNWTGNDAKNYVEITTENAKPTVTTTNEPTGKKIEQVGTAWKLVDSAELDKLGLQDAINQATNPALASAVEEAKNVLANAKTQEEINAAEEKLYDAIEAAMNGTLPPAAPVVDKAPLTTAKDALVGVQAADTTGKTQATVDAYNTAKQEADAAVAEAQKVLDNPAATEAEVAAAKKTVEDAKAKLEAAKNGLVAVDKAPLTTAKDALVGVQAADTTGKTQATVDAYNTAKQEADAAVAEAQKVLDNPVATEAEVAAAKKTVEDAKAKLETAKNGLQDEPAAPVVEKGTVTVSYINIDTGEEIIAKKDVVRDVAVGTEYKTDEYTYLTQDGKPLTLTEAAGVELENGIYVRVAVDTDNEPSGTVKAGEKHVQYAYMFVQHSGKFWQVMDDEYSIIVKYVDETGKEISRDASWQQTYAGKVGKEGPGYDNSRQHEDSIDDLSNAIKSEVEKYIGAFNGNIDATAQKLDTIEFEGNTYKYVREKENKLVDKIDQTDVGPLPFGAPHVIVLEYRVKPVSSVPTEGVPTVEVPEGNISVPNLPGQVPPTVELPEGNVSVSNLPGQVPPTVEEKPEGNISVPNLPGQVPPTVEEKPEGNVSVSNLPGQVPPTVELPEGKLPQVSTNVPNEGEPFPTVEVPEGNVSVSNLPGQVPPTVELPEGKLPQVSTTVPNEGEPFPTVDLPEGKLPEVPTTEGSKETPKTPEVNTTSTTTVTKQSTTGKPATKQAKKTATAGALPKTSATTESNAALPAGLAAALVAAGLLTTRRKENK